MGRAWLKAELHQALQRLIDAAYHGGNATRPPFGVRARPSDPDVMLLDAIEELQQWRVRQRAIESADQVINRLNHYYGARADAAARAGSDVALYWRIKQETIQQVAKNLEIFLRPRNQGQEGEMNNGR